MRARCSVSDAWIRLYGQANELGHARLGLAVSRRYGNAAQRNRIKRLIREAFRHIRHELPAADYIVMPFPGPEPDREHLQESIRHMAERVVSRRGSRAPGGQAGDPRGQ